MNEIDVNNNMNDKDDANTIREEDEDEAPQAYAKLIGSGWQYYMTKPKIILGRGGNGVDCDVHVSRESAVSRQHFSIRYAPESQGMEIENISKNGILINGEFKKRFSKPSILKTQCEIAYGRFDKMRITLVLPNATKPIEKRKKHYPYHHHSHIQKYLRKNGMTVSNNDVGRFLPFLQCIGFVLINERKPQSLDEIIHHLKQTPCLKNQHFNELSTYQLKGSTRHTISQNNDQFKVVNRVDGKELNEPKFTVSSLAKTSFEQFARLIVSEHASKSKNNNKNIANSSNITNNNNKTTKNNTPVNHTKPTNPPSQRPTTSDPSVYDSNNIESVRYS